MAAKMIDLGNQTGSSYTKEGDNEGFLRFRLNGKVVVDGKICQLNGFLTQVKGQE